MKYKYNVNITFLFYQGASLSPWGQIPTRDGNISRWVPFKGIHQSSVPLKRMVEPYIWNSLKQNYRFFFIFNTLNFHANKCETMCLSNYMMGNWAETNLCQLNLYCALFQILAVYFYTLLKMWNSVCVIVCIFIGAK